MRTKKTIKTAKIAKRGSAVISEGTLDAIIEDMRERYIISHDDKTSATTYISIVSTLVKKGILLPENVVCRAIDSFVKNYNDGLYYGRSDLYNLYQAAKMAEASGLFKKAIDVYAMILHRIPVHLGGSSVIEHSNITDKLSSIAKKSGFYTEVFEVFMSEGMHKHHSTDNQIVTKLGDAAVKAGDIEAAITIYGMLSIEEHRLFHYDGVTIGTGSSDKKMEDLARKNKMLDKVMSIYMLMANEYIKDKLYDSEKSRSIKAYLAAYRIASEAGLESDKEKIEVKLTEQGYKRESFPEWFAGLVQ